MGASLPSHAERLFAAWLRDREAGCAVPWKTLLEAEPGAAAELEELRPAWERCVRLFGELEPWRARHGPLAEILDPPELERFLRLSRYLRRRR